MHYTTKVLTAAALLGGVLGRSAPAQAVAPDTLRLVEALSIARQANPMLHAARASATAAAQRIGPAGALPDPQLQFGLLNRMASDFGSTADPMTMNQLQLMQMLPWPGKLGGARQAARHTAAAAGADADEQERMLVAQVRVLRAQVEVARMGEEITRMGQERLAMAARLNALLGRAAMEPIAALELPEPAGDLPSGDSLVAWAATGRPALVAGAERVAAAEAVLSAARREVFPDFTVGVAYQQRPQFPTMVSLMVGINVPVFAGAKQLPMRRQMAAMRDMSAAELLNLRNETTARIVEIRARAELDRNLVRLYRGSILPQGRAAVQSSVSGYRVGRVPFMQLLDNQMTVNRYETEAYRLLADYQQAIGELEALVGREVQP